MNVERGAGWGRRPVSVAMCQDLIPGCINHL